MAERYVARADLAAPGAKARIARLAAHPRVAGIRQTIRWHPDERLRWSKSARMDDPAWLDGVRMLAEHGLLLEFLMYPFQAEAVVRLAEAHPTLQVVINHCSSPIDRDEAGLSRWRDGLATMARAQNVGMKLSNVPAYAGAATMEATRAVLRPLIEAFGAGRTMWGSDYPVARRNLSYATTLGLFREALSELPHADRSAILNGNAARIYGLDLGR